MNIKHLTLIACTSVVMLFSQASVTAQETTDQPTGHDATPAGGTESLIKREGTKSELVAVLKIRDNLDKVFTATTLYAKEVSETIVIDTVEARDYITTVAAGKGWGPETAAEKVNQLIKEGEIQLNIKIPKFKADLLAKINASYLQAAKQVEPKALFQADYDYYVTKENENKWSRGGVNLESLFNGLILTGDATLGFKAGVAAGLSADVDFKLFLKIEASLVLDGFNPVSPVAGVGRVITIKATPKYKTTIGGAAGGEAFLKIVTGVGFPGNGVLPDIQSTLSL